MNTLIISIGTREDVNARVKAAAQGMPQGSRLTFPDLRLLHKTLTPNRWTIIEHLQRQGAMGLRALARELGVDSGNLARDIRQLKDLGLVEDSADGLVVPYDAIRLEVVLSRAA
ncbi:MarR family transcriptional regulator [Magnetovirga frankeli]|uniref:HVO_A0114 family putative DNA-binding protein n=1 Tax=Magnetovirga frankeli TaxID=947516 RepID=UPI001293383A|nr:MarR family transcriptional regulator [gamma proteobacterium SS-5]